MSSKKKTTSLDTIYMYTNLLFPENKLILPISLLKLPMKSVRICKFAGGYHFEIADNPSSFFLLFFFLSEKNKFNWTSIFL